MGRADAEIEIADRRRLGRDDVNVDGELVGMEAERLLDAMQAVERVEGGERLQDNAAHQVDRIPAGDEQIVDVRLFDLAPTDADHDAGDVADHTARGKTDEGVPQIHDGDHTALHHPPA